MAGGNSPCVGDLRREMEAALLGPYACQLTSAIQSYVDGNPKRIDHLL